MHAHACVHLRELQVSRFLDEDKFEAVNSVGPVADQLFGTRAWTAAGDPVFTPAPSALRHKHKYADPLVSDASTPALTCTFGLTCVGTG